MTAADVVNEIVEKNSAIKSISIFSPPLAPLIQDRGELDENDDLVLERSSEIRKDSIMPFWDSVMLAAVDLKNIPFGILKSSTYHNKSNSDLIEIERNDISSTLLESFFGALAPNKLIAISSHVKCFDGISRHIPQIDFHCKESLSNLSLIVEIIKILDLKGYILRSGKSYHFYGSSLLASEKFFEFMGRILLFAPIVDRSWIAHQLIEGRSALRISSRPGYGGPPTLVAELI
ncbi:hypothetical protein HSX11_17035 [Oxalobacteraceae bacterium]|nr:hypothetical protein [Oxalobacteraceae bacterium]